MKMHQKLKVVLKALAIGIEIKTESGHTLGWSEEHDAPGFRATRTDGDKSEEILFQIDSETAWMYVISYAKNMTDEDTVGLAAAITLNEVKKR